MYILHTHKNQWKLTQMDVVDIHCLQHYIFVPVHRCLLGWNPRQPFRRKEEEKRLYHMERGNSPHGQRKRDEIMQIKRKSKLFEPGMDGVPAESSWGAAFPGIYKSSILRTAPAACVSEEWIQHIVNNWCASKHRRYMHTWSEYINSSHGWFILWRTAFNLLVTLDQLNINFVFLVISAVKLKLITAQVGESTYRKAPGNENAYVSIL